MAERLADLQCRATVLVDHITSDPGISPGISLKNFLPRIVGEILWGIASFLLSYLVSVHSIQCLLHSTLHPLLELDLDHNHTSVIPIRN